MALIWEKEVQINSMVTHLLMLHFTELLHCCVKQRQNLTLVIALVTLHCTMPAVMDTFR